MTDTIVEVSERMKVAADVYDARLAEFEACARSAGMETNEQVDQMRIELSNSVRTMLNIIAGGSDG